jgi:predicted ester cyclase
LVTKLHKRAWKLGDVAVAVTFVGTHRGVYEGFKPTNKKSRFTDMQILRFENGRIVESFLGSGGLRLLLHS